MWQRENRLPPPAFALARAQLSQRCESVAGCVKGAGRARARRAIERVSEVQQEAAKIRRLQIMVCMVMSVIAQDPNLTIEEASELVAGTKRAALAMFPDKEFAYDILYKPRLQRLMRERFRLQ
jgi:hypothetical protein